MPCREPSGQAPAGGNLGMGEPRPGGAGEETAQCDGRAGEGELQIEGRRGRGGRRGTGRSGMRGRRATMGGNPNTKIDVQI